MSIANIILNSERLHSSLKTRNQVKGLFPTAPRQYYPCVLISNQKLKQAKGLSINFTDEDLKMSSTEKTSNAHTNDTNGNIY